MHTFALALFNIWLHITAKQAAALSTKPFIPSYLFMTKIFTLTSLGLLLGSQVFAGGYQVSIQGQKQIGMGHTGTAIAWDASSIFFNPGSLGFLKKSSVVAGASFIRASTAYVGNDGQSYKAETDNPLGTPFAAYGAFFVDKNKKIVVGLGANTPFGSTTKWDDNWKGADQLRSLKLQTIVTYATVAYRVHEKVSVGAGFNYAFGSVDLKRRASSLYNGTTYADVQLKGPASGMGFNVGLHLAPTQKLSVGITYRSQIDMKVENGDATLNNAPKIVLDGNTFPISGATKFNATLPLPAVTAVGIAYKATEALTVAIDVNFVQWSAYKELKFDFVDNFNASKSTASPRKYKDSFIYRVGTNYAVNNMIDVRAGGYFDQTPVQNGYMTPETPDANRVGLTLGAGIKPIENLSIDASLLFIMGQKRTQSAADAQSAGTQDAVQPGTYQQRAFAPGIQVSYQF